MMTDKRKKRVKMAAGGTIGAVVGAKIGAGLGGSRERHNQALEDRLNAVPECPADADAVTAMKYRLQTAEGKPIYSKRKATVETVFGVIKEVLGFRAFLCAGYAAPRGEWSLVCTAWNLKRLYALVATG